LEKALTLRSALLGVDAFSVVQNYSVTATPKSIKVWFPGLGHKHTFQFFYLLTKIFTT